ncbi:MAG: NAD(P)/FAD-dependent oxidoreductase [Rhodococcus sp. (in: high G+C Gram-positive bacteria)]|uniref:flavin-containing monooxygenase n=1 Tax=Rhodococcus sp. TaxID=1831 RepID=UPI003BB4CFF3
MDRDKKSVDVVVVGAGVAGMYAVHTLRSRGLTVQGIESAAGVGGTWYHNRYPGARCDVESVDYSFSFDDDLQQEWTWSERFATQPEILAYLDHVADRFGLRRHFRFSTRVVSAEFDESGQVWHVRTDGGEVITGRYCIFATGCLSATNVPDIPGRDDFRGEAYHTGSWPHDGVDFRGKRVGVIGTGSSGMQSIPLIAEDAEQLYVFQRTANYSIPAGNRPFDTEAMREIKSTYAERRRLSKLSGGGSPFTPHPHGALDVTDEERTRVYDEWWNRGGVLFSKAFPDQLTDLAANDTARVYWEDKIRQIVTDPELAAKLIPGDHPIGTKRIVTDSGYFDTFNRDNVTLVDLKRTPIDRITETGIATADGQYDIDILVFATGFDAMTGALSRIDIRGRGGRRLADDWAAGPRTYLGLGVSGFPNMFLVNGAGSPGPLANMVLASEQHLDWIVDCIEYVDGQGAVTVEASPDAVDAWVAELNERASKTLFPTANSWYLGANIPGKPRVFMPFIGGYAEYGRIIDGVAGAGYKGFVLEGNA